MTSVDESALSLQARHTDDGSPLEGGVRLRALLRRNDGSPASYAGVLAYAVDRIREASASGVGLRLSAEQVRALDYSVIREAGGIETSMWRDTHCTAGNPNG